MAEEAKGQRFSQRAGWFLDKITGSQWAQQTQQTQQQTSGQQSTGGIFLPWISNNQNLINSNKVSVNNGFTQWIQEWTIKSNIVLPWITNKPNEATLDTTTMKQKRQSYIYAKNNNINTKSINEQIEEERTWSNKVLGQTGKILKTYREAPINNFKKRWMRAIADSWLPWYFVDKTLEKAWAPDGLGDSIKNAVNETARKVALTYQDKVNEDFQKKVDKNIDARIREKYDNESITDLIWKWDGAWARYKIWKWTVENWNMIPEIWLMFVNPYVWLATMWTDVYIQENQWTFEDMLQNWATYEQARNGAVVVWILNAGIELFMERFLWWAKWAWATALRRLFLKNAQREVVKQATKKWMAEIFARWVSERLKGSMVEWFEEVLQQITGNIMVKLINPDRDILDWARESFEWWFYNLFNWIWWATNIANEFKQNEQIQRNADIEALKYVAEWEQRKAQRMAREKARARFLERVKNPTMDNGYTPTPEQAQQRAREKEENEQFEDELRAEQNRENSKYQETEWENSWLSDTNDYTEWRNVWGSKASSEMATEKTVNTLDEESVGSNGEVNSPVTDSTFFSTDENWDYIVYDDGNWEQKIYAWSNRFIRDWVEKSQFTELSDKTPYDPELEEYSKNFQRLVEKLSDPKVKGQDFVVIWRTEKGKEVRLSKQALKHIIEDHGKINVNTLLKAINKPTKQRWETKTEWKNRPYIILDLWSKNKEFLVWLAPDSWTKNEDTAEYYTVTTSREAWAPKTPARDTRFQLKYEEEWYTPWVARKDEKNISWKSGKILKDFLKWQTIEELAKKYWVERIDVVKWLVDGMAYGSYSNRILRLAEEIKESTAPHELLHLVFDMVDPETKTYLISQVMQSEWWSAEKAEEWLADSFSNFYRTGKIESAPKSTWGKIKIFFKRVRSFINGMWKWRNQLEQMFTDIIESSGIEELQGKIDSNKEINESKAKMRKRFLEYRRNAEKTQEKTKKSKVKYQKVWDIDPEATSPENLIEVNDKWLDVMVKFVSEKQKKNATDVNKELLTDNGNPYMWTSTNKYKSKVITDWRNVEDSKYKEYTDKWIQVARFTNNSSMSYSYAGYKSKLAPVKKFKSIDELNKFFKENPNNYERILWNWIDDGTLKSSVVYEMKENDGKFELISNSTETLTQSMKDFYDGINNDWFWGNIWEMPENKDEALKKLQEYYNEHDYEIDWERTVKLLKNWNVERTVVKEPTVYKRFDTKLDALAEWYTIAQEADLYHYQWIIQKMKNPLVVDIRSKDNTPSTWSKLWTINDIFDKEWINYNKEVDYYIRDVEEAMDGFSKRMKALEQYWNDAYRDDPYGEVSQFMWNVQISANNWVAYMVDELEDLLNDSAMWEDLKIGLDTEVYGDLRDYGRTLRDVIIELRNFINTDRNYYALKKLSPEWIENWVKDMGAPKEVVKMIKNKNWKDMLGNWRDIGDKWWRENIKELLTTNWMDLETNDWVRYALDSGKYDWVIFKNIIDYGWLPKEWWENAKGGDVAVTFRSNQFKTWDNEDPTDSKYIRYQRVYHWSPAEFNKFDSSHMWEWEWDQVHGRWHYVAVDPKTGREYAETLAWPRYKGKEMYELASDLPWYQWNVINHVAEQMRDGVDPENAIANDKKWHEYLLNKAEENLKTEKDEDSIDYLEREIKQQKEMIKIADWLKVSDFETSRWRRNFYEVEIPDIVDADTPTWTNYFEENKVLTRSEIEKILNKLLKRKTQWAERVKNAIDYDLKDWEKIDGRAMVFNLRAWLWNKKASKFLESLGYDGIHYFWGKDWEAYVIFNDNDLEIKNHEKYQKVEYEYDENGNRKWIKFEEDNGEFDPSIFWEPTREEQIADDKENEKNNPFYNARIKYNNQNYKDDQLTFEEFVQWISERWDKEQAEYNKKLSDISEAQNDPQLLDLQLRAVKLMEEEWNVGKKFWKNVSKEVRDRQQKEVESKREQLISDIVDYMYPWLKTEEITYDMQKEADQKEAEREMLGREDLEEKLKYFKKDKNGNREAKEVKIENPQIKLDKILSAGKFEEIFTPLDRVIERRTPQWQHGVIDNQKNPKQYKSVMEKINAGKTKTKVTLKDVTRDYRALEKYKADQEAEKARKKKERDEAYAKKKQEEYKKIVRMKAFQRLVDMQRFEKYPFLTEEEIKNRYGFTDEEWKKITEQEEIKLPKKRWEKAISDLNKAVDSQVKALIEWLSWQNNLKRKDAEKNLWEIWEIDVDILLGRDEEKWQKEVEEFEKLAKEEKEQDSKLEDWKTEFEKEMDRKTRKQKKQAEKLTKQWNEMFRKAEEKRNERYANKEEKKIDEVKSVDEAKALTKDSRWKRTKNFWKDTTIQDLIQPISSRIEKISPRIYLEMMRFEQRIAIKQNTRMKQVEDFVKKMAQIRKNNKKDYLNITLHLLNGNVGTANQMLEKYGTSIPRQVLDEIWADAEDVGYTMNYEGFYYPRKVKDVQEFLDRFAKTENKDVQWEIDKVVRKAEEKARKRGEEFTPQQKADLINQLLMDGEVEWISLWSWHMKKRKVDSITKNMLEFYEDPVDSILQYINWMTEAIEKARFLWQWTKWEIKTLWEFIADEWISGYDADELKKLLLSRFNYAPMWEMMSKLKVSANIIHLWSPSSALSQLADVSFSLIENGLVNIVQWLAKRYNLDLDALWITNRWEELKTQWKNETWWEKIQRFTFKWTGFNMMDQFWKKLLIVSTLNKLIRYAKRNDPQLRKDLSRRFDDPKMIDGVIEDLKAWKMSENVNLFLFTKLADVQPLTRTQMTRTYLQAGNWRVLYAFKTFGIKQLDYIIQKSRRELQTKPTAKALWSIVTMLGIIMLCGAGDDELKDFSMWRKYSSWIWRMIEWNDWSASQLSDRFWDNFLKLFGFTKYSIYQARTQGIKSAIEDIFFSLPWLDMFTYPLQDIQNAMSEDGLDFSQASSWQLIPIVGKYGYWWAWAWQTKQQKSLEKEKKSSSWSKSSKKSSSSKGQLSR